MAKVSEDNRRNRLDRILRLLQQHPDGLTEREIADALNFERRTTYNYLQDLEIQTQIYKDGLLWCPTPYRQKVPGKIEPSPEEAVVLYLASRMVVKQNDRRNEVAESALLKLATILSNDMGLATDLVKAAQELAHRPQSPGYENIFRVVAQGYIYRRKIQILYHPYHSEPFETTISPYLLEPSAIGFATYVIGYSSAPAALRTYKLERISRAELLRHNEYDIPPDFPGLELLRNAWSIYYGEALVRVVLRFHPDVARRIHETNWHPSQQLIADEQKPGYVRLCVQIADTTDLKPWIRGWGANCEVLEPAELRDEMMGEARKFAELYGWQTLREATTNDDDPLGLDQVFGNFFG